MYFLNYTATHGYSQILWITLVVIIFFAYNYVVFWMYIFRLLFYILFSKQKIVYEKDK